MNDQTLPADLPPVGSNRLFVSLFPTPIGPIVERGPTEPTGPNGVTPPIAG